jgi:glycosyltransferase involved in cell wall biosynthesis
MIIAFLVRSRTIGGFSVERVFDPIIPHIENRFKVRVFHLPYESNSILKMMLNSIFGWWVSRSADVCHMTGDQTYAMLFVPRCKSIITIHDCSFTPQGRFKTLKKWIRELLHIRLPAWRAGAITVISEATRKELIALYPNCRNKVVLIGNAIDDRLVPHKREFPAYPRIVQFGRLERKNLSRVIEALIDIPCHLRIIGQITDEQRKRLVDLGIDYSQVQGLADEAMLEEYRQADILSFPSTYEGFGVPILEGQASGAVVLTSRIEPMCGVAGGGAILVDPFDSQSIRKGFLWILSSPKFREEIVALGTANVAAYSSRNIAERYLEVYRELQKDGSRCA